MTLGEKLTSLRAGRSRNDIEVALKEHGVKVSYNTVKRWEEGGLPRLDEAVALTKVFGVSLDYLADEEMEKPPALAGRNNDEARVWKVVAKIGADYAAWVLEGIEDLSWSQAKALLRRHEGDLGSVSYGHVRRDGHAGA